MFDAIIGPIAWLMGKILDILFVGLNGIGLGNIAIAIVVFTLIVKLIMTPFQLKQAKMAKLNVVINPEIKAIQEKYKGKMSDQNAMAKQQAEIKAVYEKYGTSQMETMGCTQLLIQFPLIFGLYRVIQYIPMYVSELKDLLINILGNAEAGIMAESNFVQLMSDNFQASSRLGVVDWSNLDSAITAMNYFSAEQWDKLRELFPAYANVIAENQAKITDMSTIFSININETPQFAFTLAALIPILAGLSQYISVRVGQSRMPVDQDNPAAASMKMMTLFMPIMSAFMAFSFPVGIGIYWTATAVFQTIIQVVCYSYYDKIGLDAIIQKNIEKKNKKRAKKGLPPQKIAANATANTKKVDSIQKNKERIARLQEKKEENDKKVKEILATAQEYKGKKPGSLAQKAGMVARYNEKTQKK